MKDGVCRAGDQIPEFILNKLQSNKNLECIFDDVSATFRSDYQDPLFALCGLFHNDEVYYCINRQSISKSLINQCLAASNSIWHSLCVLFEKPFEKTYQEPIASQELMEIAKQTKLILVGAYDGEGYLLWEKN